MVKHETYSYIFLKLLKTMPFFPQLWIKDQKKQNNVDKITTNKEDLRAKPKKKSIHNIQNRIINNFNMEKCAILQSFLRIKLERYLLIHTIIHNL